MAKLILSVDGTVLKEISLAKERTTLGRKPHNDIQVDNLAVSGEHAAIITILNDSFIEDLNSTNGTLVNGKPIKKHFLQNNDVIEIGKHKLKYFNDTPVQSAAADFERTMIIRRPSAPAPMAAPSPSTSLPPSPAPSPAGPGGASLSDTHTNMRPMSASMVPPPVPTASAAKAAPTAAPAASPAPAASAVREAAIQVLSGAAAGRTLDLVKNLTTIGKPGVQVAVITRRPNGFFITHVEGTSFPTINGTGLGGQAQQLNDHDLIEIAGVKMEFFFKP
ncbi:MAG: FHA domain-containing protein [Aeromicrobium sp.]|nr:FHA domain-containing protein [Burkholderiales bacterium]